MHSGYFLRRLSPGEGKCLSQDVIALELTVMAKRENKSTPEHIQRAVQNKPLPFHSWATCGYDSQSATRYVIFIVLVEVVAPWRFMNGG